MVLRKHYLPIAAVLLLWRSIEGFTSTRTNSVHLERCSSLRIFFKSRDDSAGDSVALLEELASSEVKFPTYAPEFLFKEVPESLCFRPLGTADVDEIVSMCMDEYSPDGKDLSSTATTSKIVDAASLRILIEVTCKMKASRTNDIPKDHAILVATRGEDIVGMIEVSQQPPDPTRNPGAVPLPLWGKRLTGGGRELQGWVANLLIRPSFRRKGLGKFLVAAAEGVARSWGSKSIHLHCDADPTRGRVAQRLYLGLGYEPLAETNPKWAVEGEQGPNPVDSSVFVIDGVPLLYLKKQL